MRRLLFLFLFLAALLPQLSHAVCKDSDGGGSGQEFILGACSSDYDYLVDNCTGAVDPKLGLTASLDERECAGDRCVTASFKCANGCLLGACRSQQPAPAANCSGVFLGESSSQPEYSDVIVPAVEGQVLSPSFGQATLTFGLKNWAEDRLILNDSSGTAILLDRGVEFSYLLSRGLGFQDGDVLGINYTRLSGSGAEQNVEVVFALYRAGASQQSCLVLWSPRNYSYSLSQSQAGGFLDFEVQSPAKTADEAGGLVCAYSSNGREAVRLDGVKLNERFTAKLEPAPSIGSNYVSIACSSGGKSLSLVEYYAVLPDSLESVALTAPENASVPLPAGYAFELRGLEGFAYYCDGLIDAAWFPVARADGKPVLDTGAYSGNYGGLVDGQHYARFRCNRSSGSDYFYSNGVYFTAGNSTVPTVLTPSNGSLYWSSAVNLTYSVPAGLTDCFAYLGNATPVQVPGGAGWHSFQLTALFAGLHSLRLSCRNAASAWVNSSDVSFQTAEADRPLITSPAQGSVYYYAANATPLFASVPISFVVNGSYPQYNCSQSLNGNVSQLGNVTAGVEKTAQANLTLGNYTLAVSCRASAEKTSTVAFSVNLSGTPFVLQPELASPFYNRNYTTSTIDLDFKVQGTFPRYDCYEKMDAAANWTFVIAANNSERVLWGKRYANLSNGAHSLAFRCVGLVQGNESQYQANTTAAFRVASSASLGPAETARLPPLPTVVPPLPSPRPAVNRLELSCPSFASSSSTAFTGVLYVGGTPRCDPNTRVTVTVNGEPGRGSFNLCTPSSGEHEYSVETSQPGNYTVTVQALSYDAAANCSFSKRGVANNGEETPELPLWVALAAAALAFAAVKRKQ